MRGSASAVRTMFISPALVCFSGGATAAWVVGELCGHRVEHRGDEHFPGRRSSLLEIAGRQASCWQIPLDGEFSRVDIAAQQLQTSSSRRPAPRQPVSGIHIWHTARVSGHRVILTSGRPGTISETSFSRLHAGARVVSNTASVSVVDRPVSDSAGPAANRSLFSIQPARAVPDSIPGSRCWPDRQNVIMQLGRPGDRCRSWRAASSGRIDRHPIQKRARTTFTYLAVATRESGSAEGLPQGGDPGALPR